uniref:Uncharacterized protein n=1 Tax=Arundo donax TaxID=35708 RepID=A0A0A9A8Y2_ARUDO
MSIQKLTMHDIITSCHMKHKNLISHAK